MTTVQRNPEQDRTATEFSELSYLAREAFDVLVFLPLFGQVKVLDELANNPALGLRYAWEVATKWGEKPGDAHKGTWGLAKWLAGAAKEGVRNAGAIVNGHADYQELVQRLDRYRGWGAEPAFILKQQPDRQPEPVQFVSTKARQTKLLSGLDLLAGQQDLFQTDGE